MKSFKIPNLLLAIKFQSFLSKFLMMMLLSLFIISNLSAGECLHEAKEAFEWDKKCTFARAPLFFFDTPWSINLCRIWNEKERARKNCLGKLKVAYQASLLNLNTQSTRYNTAASDWGNTVESVKSNIRTLASSKGKDLQVSLNLAREEGRLEFSNFQFIRKVSHNYAISLKGLEPKYQEITSKFEHYFQSNDAEKNRLSHCINDLIGSSSIQSLITAKLSCESLYVEELRNYSDLKDQLYVLSQQYEVIHELYSTSISEFSDILIQNEIPRLKAPTILLKNIESMISYADSRSDNFREQLIKSFGEIGKKKQAFLDQEFTRWQAQHSQEAAYHEESMAFLNEVNALIHKVRDSTSSEDGISKIASKRLRKRYDAYFEILTYKATCFEMERMKKEGSSIYSGCTILHSVIEDAEDFMRVTGWTQIGFGIFNMRKAPHELGPLIAELKSMKAHKNQGTVSLIDAIKVYDTILDRWDLMLATEGA
ncbi:MAG: hypothetical protein ABIQ95_02895 [Bdellovibrionia bacterium]